MKRYADRPKFSPLRLVTDTADLPRSSQYEFWIERTRDRAARWNVERLDPAAGFRGRASYGRIGAILIAENHNDPFRIWRNSADTADGEWLYLVMSSVEAFAAGGGHHRFAPGELVFIDSQWPTTLGNSRFARTRYLTIPRAAIPLEKQEVDSQRAPQVIPRSHPLGRMLHCHFDGLFDLVRRPQDPSAQLATLAARQLLELLAVLCTARNVEAAAMPVSNIAAARYRDVLNLMRRHCADPKLRPEWVATRAGLSRASLYRLFKLHQTRFSDVLTDLRLEHARGLLAAVGKERMSLTEIAIVSGFVGSSAFSHRFRKAFGQTPSEYRYGCGKAAVTPGQKRDVMTSNLSK